MSEDINKDLHEKVMGACGHEWYKPAGFIDGHVCKKCGLYWPVEPEMNHGIPSYTSNSSDYWKLLQKVKEHEKWPDFEIRFRHIKDVNGFTPWLYCKFTDIILDTQKGSQAIWEFFCKDPK